MPARTEELPRPTPRCWLGGTSGRGGRGGFAMIDGFTSGGVAGITNSSETFMGAASNTCEPDPPAAIELEIELEMEAVEIDELLFEVDLRKS